MLLCVGVTKILEAAYEACLCCIVLKLYTAKINRVHEQEWSCQAMCNRVQYFKPIQLPIKWSSLSSNQYSLLSDHALWRNLHTYPYLLKQLSVLNENKSNMIRGIETISRAEKLPGKYGLSCWKYTKWTRFIFSV